MRSRVCIVSLITYFLLTSCVSTLSIDEPVLHEDVSPSVFIKDEPTETYSKEVDYPVVPEDHPVLECMRKKHTR